jgi:predicted secreted protein
VPATTRKSDPLRRIILKSASASGAIGVLLASGLLRPTGVLAADWNRPAFTATSLPDAIKASGLTGSVESSGIVIKMVDIAENGAQVPLEVVSNIAGSQTIAVFVDKNKKNPPEAGPYCTPENQARAIFDACLPLGPCVTSKETFSPSLRVLNPPMVIAEKCAKRSSLPSSGVMKPKPLASLNHLTVPVAILLLP